jgi:hypothetical protein
VPVSGWVSCARRFHPPAPAWSAMLEGSSWRRRSSSTANSRLVASRL